MYKTCIRCHRTKKLTAFPKDKTSFRSRCKPCYAEHTLGLKGKTRQKRYKNVSGNPEAGTHYHITAPISHSRNIRTLDCDMNDVFKFTMGELLTDFSAMYGMKADSKNRDDEHDWENM